MTKKCPTCGGDGIVVSEQTAAVEVERRLRALVAPGSRTQAYRVEVNDRIAAALIGPGASRLAEIEELTRRTFFLVPKEDVHLDHFAVLEQGSLAKLKPEAPFEAGATVRVELGEVGRYDAHAGVGRVDGYAVVVADAAKLVGKTVKVELQRVLDGFAYATLVQPVAKPAPPITAEGEAEKPTRARKATSKAAVAEEKAEEAVAEAEEAAAEVDVEDEDEAEGATAPKKRTRRGSRGGRRRKKKPVEGAGEQAAEEVEPESESESESEPEPEPEAESAPEAPRIHVPPPELGEDGDGDEAPRKRTRRGSRGGRRRKKKPAETVSQNGDEPAEEAAEPSENGGAEADWEYVPMSEWGDEFRS